MCLRVTPVDGNGGQEHLYDASCKYWDPRNELMSPAELHTLHERRLRQVVQFAYSRSPFYRRKLDAAGVSPDDVRTLEDIERLPLTDKYDLRDSAERASAAGRRPYAELLTVPEELITAIHTTSGTTGQPFSVGLLEAEVTFRGMLASGDHCARGFWSVGMRPGDIMGHVWNLGGAMVGGGNHVIPKGACAPELFVTIIPCHVGRTELILSTLRDVGATALCCTPSYARYMAEVAPRFGIDLRRDLRIRFLICGGEPGPASIPGLREELEELWGAHAYDMYGAPGAGIAMECAERAGFHLQADGVYVEILDPDTREPLPPGEMGSIVATPLGMGSMPLLRFDTEDRGALIPEPCRCGRTHPRLASVPGRWDDMIKVKGYRLFPETIEKVARETPGCTGEFMIVLERDAAQKDQVQVQVEHRADVPDLESLRAQLEVSIRTLITLKADVQVVPPGSLPRWVMKRRRVMDRRAAAGQRQFAEALRLRSAEYYDQEADR